jgi:acyl carrier protein
VNERADSSQRSFARLQAVFRAVFDDESMDVSEATSLGTVAGWDQARHLDLLAAIEKKFGVRFTTHEVSQTAAATGTIGTLVEALSSKLEAASRSLRSSLKEGVSEGQRRRMLELWVREQVAAVLGIRTPAVGPEKVFQDLGMTSLTAVELCSRLETGLGLSLAPTLMYNYPTVALLVPYLEGKLGSAGESNG